MPPFRCAECPLRGAELWRFCRSEAARLSELRADRNIAHGELASAPVSLDAPVAERNDQPSVTMAEAGDQHNGGPTSGKAVLGAAREVAQRLSRKGFTLATQLPLRNSFLALVSFV